MRAGDGFREAGRRIRRSWILLPLLWALVGYVLHPALMTLAVSLRGPDGGVSLAGYAAFFTSVSELTALRNSVLLGVLTVLVCGVIGTWLAFFMHAVTFPGKRVLDKLFLLPMMMPGIIIVYAFVQLYGESGLATRTLQLALSLDKPPLDLVGLPGILTVHAFTQYAFFYIAVSLAIRRIDGSVIESARCLGASRGRIFFSVILPFLTPALVTASAITFMTGAGSFTAPSIIGGSYRVLTTRILLSKANNYLGMAAVETAVLTALSMVFFLGLRWYEGRRTFAPSVRAAAPQRLRIANPWLKGGAIAATAGLTVLILLPFFTILLYSFVDSASLMVSVFPETFTTDNFTAILTRRRAFAPFVNSVLMSLLAGFLCLAVALPAAYVIEKTTLRLRWLIDLLVTLPWALPASAVAINLISAAAEPSVFSFSLILAGSSLLLPLGYCIKGLPLMAKTAHVSFQNLNGALLEASRSLGATGARTFRRITLPVLYPGLLAGFLLVFVRSVGEYATSAFLYTPSNKPISIAMVNAVFEYKIGVAMAYGTLLIVLTSVLALVIGRLRPRGMEGAPAGR